MKKRPVSKDFINAMEEKLEHGRRRKRKGWDSHWAGYLKSIGEGPTSYLMRRLFVEVFELQDAVLYKSKEMIRLEAADVANFAMFIADCHGALEE